MRLEIYGLHEPPFASAPDVRFAFLCAPVREAIEQLQHEVVQGSGGILLLTGENGSGKTLLMQCLLQRLPERDVRVARVLHSRLTPIELLQTVCETLRVPLDPALHDSGKAMIDALSAFLVDIYAQGQRVLLVVDEAQNLSDEALEQLRLLTNLETPAHKLIHVLLLGTPALRERLQGEPLKALAQRIAANQVLAPLSADQAEAYIRHRLQVAGAERAPFTRLAMRGMFRYSHGLPRVLNTLGERALSMGAAAGEATIGESTVQRAARESLHENVGYWLRRYRWWWGAALVVLLLAVIYAVSGGRGTPTRVAALIDPQRAVHAEATRLVQALPESNTAKLLAWSELLARWQVGSDEASVADASHCNAVIFPGFDCVGGTGTLDQLKRFDRPLVLELELPDGPREVLLLGVGEREVRLDIGPRDMEISRQALQSLWHGHFYASFRLPASLPVSLRRGDTGEAVAWLEERLSRLDDDTAGTYRPAIFDERMEQRVRKLQRGFGIPADGIVGPETLFALSSMDDSGPHLARNVP